MSLSVSRRSLLFILTLIHGSSYAASAYEQEQLSLVQQQLDTIEHLATRAVTANTVEPGERYRFDYFLLIQDIQRIRQGVQNYLSPSRAQPRDHGELVGDYRLDTQSAEPPP
ncbi:integrative conjugative element protein, RAQPRD family [Pseudomonas veronii]|uniref:integrative conjugative element protein, RAQPRD family n=1 Tax=Pseudomonas veronii TaxID=76761 RepID=UPI002D77018A|nr:RAQPRD family integrative conjugative element protein [Pseudomonas veronii]WRU64897.1 RAQPRD family integrative conjugative element protein [Pseudomonas veronii]